MNKDLCKYLISEIQNKLNQLSVEIQKDNFNLESNNQSLSLNKAIEMCNEILAKTKSSTQRVFIDGIKNFAETNGYLSDKQIFVLESNHKQIKESE